jgi:hypothetical protein
MRLKKEGTKWIIKIIKMTAVVALLGRYPDWHHCEPGAAKELGSCRFLGVQCALAPPHLRAWHPTTSAGLAEDHRMKNRWAC